MSVIPQPVSSATFGHGQRRVLALHCTMAHSGAWRSLIGALDDVICIAPDMLSHGQSPDWDGQGDFQDRMVAATQHLLEPGMDLIGHSYGGAIALRLAIAHPDRVRSLTLMEPIFFTVAAVDAPDVLAQHDADIHPVFDAFQAGDLSLAARLFNRSWSGGGPRWPDMPKALRAAMTRGVTIVPGCQRSVYDDPSGMLTPGVLDRLNVPSLLMRGRETQPVIAAVNDGLAHRLPNAQNVVIDGAGHMLPISHPIQVAAAVSDLFAQT